MNEAIDESALDQDLDPVEPEEAKDESHVDESMRGFMSKEDYVAKGGHPDDWRSPREFRERGELIRQKKELEQKVTAIERRTENEIKNLNMLHEIRLNAEREELLRMRDDAIDVGDRTAVKSFDRQLRDLETEESLTKEPVQQQSNIPPEVQEWNEENAWLTADHPLKSVANDVFVKAMNDGKTIAGALRLVDKELAKHKDEPAQKKVATKSMVDSPSRGTVSRSDSVGLRFEDCTREEKDMYEQLWKPSGSTMKEFLKDVSLARKGN